MIIGLSDDAATILLDAVTRALIAQIHAERRDDRSDRKMGDIRNNFSPAEEHECKRGEAARKGKSWNTPHPEAHAHNH